MTSANKSSRKVIITCAVTGSIHTPSMSPHLPVTPNEIADAAVAAAEAGAAIVHLHARDPVDGHPTQDPEVFPRVRARHRAPLRRRHQLHDRRRGDDDDRGASAAGAAAEARGGIAQHGLDELRPLSDAEALQGLQVRLGAAVSRRVGRSHLQEHVQGHRVHPDLVRRQRHALRDRVLRHRAPVHRAALLRSRHRQAAALHPERVRHPGRHRPASRTTSRT